MNRKPATPATVAEARARLAALRANRKPAITLAIDTKPLVAQVDHVRALLQQIARVPA